MDEISKLNKEEIKKKIINQEKKKKGKCFNEWQKNDTDNSKKRRDASDVLGGEGGLCDWERLTCDTWKTKKVAAYRKAAFTKTLSIKVTNALFFCVCFVIFDLADRLGAARQLFQHPCKT